MSDDARAVRVAWILGIGLLLAALIALRALQPDPARMEFVPTRLYQDAPGLVVFMGTSLTGCALPYDDQFHATGMTDGTIPHLVRVTRNNGIPEEFLAILPGIEASKSRLVLVEAEMLLRIRATPAAPLQGLVQRVHSRLRAVAIESFSQALGVRSTWSQDDHAFPCGDSAPAAEWAAVARDQRDVRSAPLPAEWTAFLRGARARGQRVVLVSMGRSASLQRRLDPAYVARFQRRLHELATQTDAQLWVFDAQSLPPGDFFDGAHLNSRGRSRFTTWLAGRLAMADGRD